MIAAVVAVLGATAALARVSVDQQIVLLVQESTRASDGTEVQRVQPMRPMAIGVVVEAGPSLKRGESLRCAIEQRIEKVTYPDGVDGRASVAVLNCEGRRLRIVALGLK